MGLSLVLGAIALAAASGLPALLLPRRGRAGQLWGTVLFVAASTAGLAGAVLGLSGPEQRGASLPWPAFGGAAALGLDPLSAFFLVPIFLVGGLCSIYALGYSPQSRNPRTVRRSQFFFGTMAAGMALLVVARHALAFILGWEAMALSAFFLVGEDDEHPETRRASLVYLIATHAGTLALFCMFALLRALTGTFELASASGLGIGAAGAVLALSFLGFGLKAGIMPLHFWLPPAHAAAPGHVSAFMSGVLIKMGIYGILRLASLLPPLPAAWGGIVLALGAISALLGVAFALAQHDLKRLLAYHSVENVGIILMGLGSAMIGRSTGNTALVALGLGGCLLHVWNHGLFKPLLFLGAGSATRAAGTRRIDLLGGLARRMPTTALLFLVGAVAICGLPPLNGFVSELLVFLGLFGRAAGGGAFSMTGGIAAAVLAMVGALALACFVKAFGAVFLGEPRSPKAERARESGAAMLAPMAVLALACAAIGVAPGFFALAVDAASACWAAASDASASGAAATAASAAAAAAAPIGSLPALSDIAPLGTIGAISAALLAAAALALVAIALGRRRREESRPTWDCGYAAPTARMQYTASSFARGLVGMFDWAIKAPAEPGRLKGAYPEPTRVHGEAGDPVLDRFLAPAFRRVTGLSSWLRRFQQGLTQHYVLFLLAALAALLATLAPFGDILALLGIS